MKLKCFTFFILLTLFVPISTAQVSEELMLETLTGNLHGTLLLPDGEGPFTVALIHPGSGPTDRDGNTAGLPGKNDSLKLLAESLAENGVASLRIDKRGVGESIDAAPSEDALRFDTYVQDAAAWLNLLNRDERFESVVAIGHSEGALIVTLAVQQAQADALVLIAGVAEGAADVLRRQLSAQLPQPLMIEVDTVLSELEAGRTVDTLPPGIAAIPGIAQALFRESVQPYLISWFRYQPAEELSQLEVPVLIVQGDNDLQVTVEDARALQTAADAELVLIEGMNHVLKTVSNDPAQNQAAYFNPDLPLADGLVDSLVMFLER